MTVVTSVHGMPRIGRGRELKWALEGYWAGRRSADELAATAAAVRTDNWATMAVTGIDLIPSNDFSLYDHVLDAALLVGAIPNRGTEVSEPLALDAYFALARGGDVAGERVAALGLTKWFDTNYHHLVPELRGDTAFAAHPAKPLAELAEARLAGIATKPVLLGPLSLLLLSRHDRPGVDPLQLLDPLLDVYIEVLEALARAGADWVQLDEPMLVTDRRPSDYAAYQHAYRRLGESSSRPRLVVSTYFGPVDDVMGVLAELPIEGVGLDFCAGPANLERLRAHGGLGAKTLFAGVIDGRNVWAADLAAQLGLLDQLSGLAAGVAVSTSCSLLHVPLSVTAEGELDPELRSWLAFADEKLAELVVLATGLDEGRAAIEPSLQARSELLERRDRDPRRHDAGVRGRVASLGRGADRRTATPERRRDAQAARLRLPVLPTTTIGSFPQTPELRTARASWRAGHLADDAYRETLRAEVARTVALQEEVGLDVLVHGEPERDDMVRYFAGELTGFALPGSGWVQSFGSRCVRPPVLYGDVSRTRPMTIEWATYAASRTGKPVKGMLTGPVTMLRWSFVRDDQPPADTATQLALAIADEVTDLQAAGIAVIQVDEPGLREGLPLRRDEHDDYLGWATRAFRLAVAPAGPDVQVHTHMCYAEFADILDALADLEVDVISLEAARSAMADVGVVASSRFGGGIGPGVYDVHSPAVPSVEELVELVARAVEAFGPERVWVNPDCGLKTRRYDEVIPVLRNLVAAAKALRPYA